MIGFCSVSQSPTGTSSVVSSQLSSFHIDNETGRVQMLPFVGAIVGDATFVNDGLFVLRTDGSGDFPGGLRPVSSELVKELPGTPRRRTTRSTAHEIGCFTRARGGRKKDKPLTALCDALFTVGDAVITGLAPTETYSCVPSFVIRLVDGAPAVVARIAQGVNRVWEEGGRVFAESIDSHTYELDASTFFARA